MPPDIINAPELLGEIDAQLGRAPPSLRHHLPALRVCLRGALERHDSVRKARRRKNDPG